MLSRTQLRLGYRYLRVPPDIAAVTEDRVSQLNAGAGFRLAERLAINYGMTYSLDYGELLTQVGSLVYASGCRCFTLGVDVGEDRNSEVFVRLQYSIVGLGSSLPRDPFAAAAGWMSGRSW